MIMINLDEKKSISMIMIDLDEKKSISMIMIVCLGMISSMDKAIKNGRSVR